MIKEEISLADSVNVQTGINYQSNQTNQVVFLYPNEYIGQPLYASDLHWL